jgi:catechol 2,3-dioxygenase-like lactoylglutathione lyase family enzyme
MIARRSQRAYLGSMPANTHENWKIVAFLATTRPEESRKFFAEVLQLKLVEESPFAIVFEHRGTTLRIQKAPQHTPAAHTALGFCVPDVPAEAQALQARGVQFERFAGLDQDAQGVWLAPSGARVAWFKDPDGNLLSFSDA